MNKQLLYKTFRNTLGATIYIFLVSQLMANGSMLFGEKDNTLMPFVLLLLFSLSAAVVGGLVLGQSIILFLDGKRSESVKAAVYSIGWLAVYTLAGVLALITVK